MDQFADILLFLVIVAIAYFTFSLVNLLVTIIKTRKTDKTLTFCFDQKGKLFYLSLCIVYIVLLVVCVICVISGITNNIPNLYRYSVDVFAIYTIIFSYQSNNVVLIGKKHMMVGRMLIDYRKMKKVNFTYHNEVTFVFGQQSYRFSTFWIDVTTLRKAISQRS